MIISNEEIFIAEYRFSRSVCVCVLYKNRIQEEKDMLCKFVLNDESILYILLIPRNIAVNGNRLMIHNFLLESLFKGKLQFYAVPKFSRSRGLYVRVFEGSNRKCTVVRIDDSNEDSTIGDLKYQMIQLKKGDCQEMSSYGQKLVDDRFQLTSIPWNKEQMNIAILDLNLREEASKTDEGPTYGLSVFPNYSEDDSTEYDNSTNNGLNVSQFDTMYENCARMYYVRLCI